MRKVKLLRDIGLGKAGDVLEVLQSTARQWAEQGVCEAADDGQPLPKSGTRYAPPDPVPSEPTPAPEADTNEPAGEE